MSNYQPLKLPPSGPQELKQTNNRDRGGMLTVSACLLALPITKIVRVYPGGVGLSVDSTTFLQLFYNLQKNTKSTILHDFLKTIVDSTII